MSLFVDSTSKKKICEFQHSTGAEENTLSKQNMERECKIFDVNIKAFGGDNCVYKADELRAELRNNDQHITYCGVGAHHQNGVAERYIRTMVEKTRTVLLNAHAIWPSFIEMELWTFAFRHVVNQWNNTPRFDLAYKTPDERFNGIKRQIDEKNQFKKIHLFGFPVYVLNDKLQDNKGKPKWLPRSRVGVYLGKSRDHASSVSYILNIKTGNISPQYYCVYDDNFTTVNTKYVDKANQLDIMKYTFDIQSSQLIVMDVANFKPSSGTSSLVEIP